ncbi:MAG: glycerophosphoryl diester phosphodiesterase membrane domain-containing protein [Qipengyuania vulgaris]
MKFDLDTAWKDTTGLVRDNLRLLAVLSGVFYFLPYLAAMLWVPGMSELVMGQFDPNSDRMEAMVQSLFADYWWAFVLLTFVQGIGLLSMLALLRRRANPTVAEAIKVGVRSVASYVVATILMGFLIGLAAVLIVAPGALTGLAAITIIGVIVLIVAMFYLFTKFSMVSPVIAIDGVLNPLEALSRSWKLTKGNSIRIFFFYVLLMVAYLVISTVVSLVFSLVFALGGAEAQTFGSAFSASLMQAVFAVVFIGVLAAVHAQLTRLKAPPAEPAGGTY